MNKKNNKYLSLRAQKMLSESEKSAIELGTMDGYAREYLESMKLYAKSIEEQIDIEHSVRILRSSYSCMSSSYIIELKTDNPDKERRYFCYNEHDVRSGRELVDPYIMAAMSPFISNNIPTWKDELDFIKADYVDGLAVKKPWSYAKNCQQMACPETGAFTAYKKVFCNDIMGYICELLIPEDAQRSSGFERKCRADKAKVVAIWDLEYIDTRNVMHFTKTRKRVARSIYDKGFIYRIGETVTPTNGFDKDRFNTCAPGIHFYMTMAEAASN